MKNKYKNLRNSIMALTMIPIISLSGCAKNSNGNESSSKESYDSHCHIIYEYCGQMILIRECEQNEKIYCVNYKDGSLRLRYSALGSDEMITSNWTIQKINSEEEENFYRTIEDSEIEQGNAKLYRKIK